MNIEEMDRIAEVLADGYTNAERDAALKRIEKKLDAVIEWINAFAKNNKFFIEHETAQYGKGRLKDLPTIDV